VTAPQVRAQQQPTWRAAADNFENLMVLVFQLWCAGRLVLPSASTIALALAHAAMRTYC
jgi:hypothetical protein